MLATLQFLGYVLDRDFRLAQGVDGVVVEWLSAEPQPTPEQIAAARHPAAVAIITGRIKAERLRRQTELGFPVTLTELGTVRFHSDAHSRSQHSGLYASATLTLMQGGTPATPLMDPATEQQVTWTAMSGVQVPLTVGVLLTLLQASMANEGAIHGAANAHIAAAAQAADPLAYDFSAGWPA